MKKIVLACTIALSLSVLVGCGDSKKEESKVVDVNNKLAVTQITDGDIKKEDIDKDKEEIKQEEKKEEKVEPTKQEEKETETKKEEPKKTEVNKEIAKKEESKKEPVKVDTNKKPVNNQNVDKTEKPTGGNIESTENKKQNLVVYSYDINYNITSKTISVDKIDANVILNILKQNNVLTSGVAINNININGRVGVIDFNEAFINRNLGSGSEAASLECVAKTYLNGLNLDKIRFTVNGAYYESGHIYIGENDYYTR